MSRDEIRARAVTLFACGCPGCWHNNHGGWPGMTEGRWLPLPDFQALLGEGLTKEQREFYEAARECERAGRAWNEDQADGVKCMAFLDANQRKRAAYDTLLAAEKGPQAEKGRG